MFRLTLTAIWLVSALSTQAQAPQYYYSSYPGSGPAFASFSFHQGTASKAQCIYKPSNFPGMPAGVFTNIYFRIGSTYNFSKPYVYNDFTVKIGYTSDSTYPHQGGWDTFKTNLMTIVQKPTFNVP